jgi:hypothetical protein
MKYNLLLLSVLPFFACNLTRDVELDLPDYDSQPVVECYLEPGKPFRLLLSRSYAFFDPFGLDSTFVEKTIIQGATVTIAYQGKTVNLLNIPSFEQSPLKFFNYTAPDIVPATPGVVYFLNIQLPDNRGNISGTTAMLPIVPIDSVVVQWSPETPNRARALTYISDEVTQTNFYRRILQERSLDSIPAQDFLVSDRFSSTTTLAFGTGFEYLPNTTIYNTIYHIDQAYYNYLESVQLALVANLNPFAQPSTIKSNVSGTADPIGIFTSLAYDRDTLIFK